MRYKKIALHAHCNNLINDEEFILLCDLNTSRNIDLESWLYPIFDLEAVSVDDVIGQFRFQKRDAYWIKNPLSFPDEIMCYFYKDLTVESTEALHILLNRSDYCFH